MWKIVTGPTTALLATIRRLGWSMAGPHVMHTDEGRVLDLRKDSPAAVAAEAAEGVRRWRWRMAGKILPGLIPSRYDLDQPTCQGFGTEMMQPMQPRSPADSPDAYTVGSFSLDSACREGLSRHGAAETGQHDLLVGCFGGVSRLLNGKSCPWSAGPVAELWMKNMRGGLASALSGGQWSQTRKASVPAIGITDSQC